MEILQKSYDNDVYYDASLPDPKALDWRPTHLLNRQEADRVGCFAVQSRKAEAVMNKLSVSLIERSVGSLTGVSPNDIPHTLRVQMITVVETLRSSDVWKRSITTSATSRRRDFACARFVRGFQSTGASTLCQSSSRWPSMWATPPPTRWPIRRILRCAHCHWVHESHGQ